MAPRVPRIAMRQSRRIRGQPVSLVAHPAQKKKPQCPRNLKKEAEKLMRAREIEQAMRMRLGPAMRLKQTAMSMLRYVKSTKQAPAVQKRAMKKASDAARSEQQHRKNARCATVLRKSQENYFWRNFSTIVVTACLGTSILLPTIAGLIKPPGIYIPPGPPNMGPYRVRFKHAGST